MIAINKRGFTIVEVFLVLFSAGILAGVGYYIYHSQQKDKSQHKANSQHTSKETETPSHTRKNSVEDQVKITHIQNYDTATPSLKQALLGTIYDEAEKACLDAKAETPNLDTTIYISVMKVVRNDFALVHYCGSGADKILANIDGAWSRVSGIGMGYPGCTDVDMYKISKEISAQCILTTGETKEVTYP